MWEAVEHRGIQPHHLHEFFFALAQLRSQLPAALAETTGVRSARTRVDPTEDPDDPEAPEDPDDTDPDPDPPEEDLPR